MKRSILPLLFLTPPVLANAAEVTFNGQIAPLIHQNCTSCHRPGEAGPFELISYEDVSKKAKTIQRVMNERYMPPWHPADGAIKYEHNRRLSDDQIALFTAWVDAGKPQGEGPTPEPPKFTEGWQLGETDMIVSMKEAYPLPAEGQDIYRNFAIPLQLPEDKWVKAIELRPSARSAVHHSLFFLDDTGTAVEADGKDGKPGFKGMGFRRSGSLGGYVPGATAQFLPGDLALPLPKGTDLVLATHFHLTGKAEMEKSTIGIYFADAPPSKTLVPIQVPAAFGRGAKIDIPAGESNYKVTDSFTIPVDVDAISIGGHAHYICQNMLMTATKPDGSTMELLRIEDWDLNWQDRYFFAETIHLPAGTVVKTDLVYDNSTDNPDNPFSPPQRIRWGHESTDEMGSITLMVTPTKNSDLAQLSRAVKAEMIQVAGAALRDVRGAGTFAMGQRIQQLDTNGDGSLEGDELPKLFRNRLLEGFDTNQDGKLDRAEITDFLETIRSRNSESKS